MGNHIGASSCFVPDVCSLQDIKNAIQESIDVEVISSMILSFLPPKGFIKDAARVWDNRKSCTKHIFKAFQQAPQGWIWPDKSGSGLVYEVKKSLQKFEMCLYEKDGHGFMHLRYSQPKLGRPTTFQYCEIIRFENFDVVLQILKGQDLRSLKLTKSIKKYMNLYYDASSEDALKSSLHRLLRKEAYGGALLSSKVPLDIFKEIGETTSRGFSTY